MEQYPADTSFADSLERVRTAYARWNVPEKFAADDSITTTKILTELLVHIESRIPQMNCRVSPSSFDANDADMRAFPRPMGWRWPSCGEALKHAGSRGVVMRLPAYWQTGIPLHAECHALGIPIFTNEPENIPVGAMALSMGGIDSVISENRDAQAFADYVVKRALPHPKLVMLVHRTHGAWSVASAVLNSCHAVRQEVHALPGVPVLHQCETLAKEKSPQFHLSEAYFWEIDDDDTFITSLEDDPLPLFRFALACTLEKCAECPCGKPVFKRRV